MISLMNITRRCECVICNQSREIRRIAALLPSKDAEALLNIYNAMFEEAGEAEMKILFLETKAA